MDIQLYFGLSCFYLGDLPIVAFFSSVEFRRGDMIETLPQIFLAVDIRSCMTMCLHETKSLECTSMLGACFDAHFEGLLYNMHQFLSLSFFWTFPKPLVPVYPSLCSIELDETG